MLKKSDYAVLLYGKKMFSLVNLYTIALTNKKCSQTRNVCSSIFV